MFGSINKTFLVAAAQFLVAATKIFFAVLNFVAVTKPFFPCSTTQQYKLYFVSLTKSKLVHVASRPRTARRSCVAST